VGFFGWFALVHAIAFFSFGRKSSAFILIKETLDVLFVLIKRKSIQTSRSPSAWGLAFFGTLAPLFLRPAHQPNEYFMGVAMQFLGAWMQIWAILSLGRSFGIVPANRGVKTAGLYRFVRHPLYFSYLVNQIGFMINNLTVKNSLLFAAGLLFQVLRIFQEERLLSEDPAYQAYSQKTRWRLMPYVF
jgi:protein-S-isoprenylcysteine O-methyltransferase Ste14